MGILGGGVAGLWLQLELSQRGFQTIILDYQHLGGFASTGNQSWLHSGAFYMVLGGTALPGGVAELCFQSSKKLKDFCGQHCPRAILKHSRCIFAFDRKRAADKALKRIGMLGVEVSFMTAEMLSHAEPCLSVDRFPFGVECADPPFDSLTILQSVITQGALAGGDFKMSDTPLTNLAESINYINGEWIVQVDNETISVAALVLAAGALNPVLLKKVNGRELKAPVKRSWIAVLHRPVVRNILVLCQTGKQNTTMFGPCSGGTTVNVEQQNVDLGEVGTRTTGSWPPTNFAWRLGAFMPGIDNNELHLYTCDKLDNCDDNLNPYKNSAHGERHFFWTDEGRNLFTFYPGKFVAAQIAAEHLADLLSTKIGAAWGNDATRGLAGDVRLAESQLIQPATHLSRRTNDHTLVIESIGRR